MKKRQASKSKKSKLNKPKLVFSIFFIAALAYFLIIRLPRQLAQPIGINEVAAVPASVTLSLPSSVKTTMGSESTIDLIIDTAGTSVTAVQVELNYDKDSISAPTLTQGDFLTGKLGNPKVQDGRIFFAYVVPLESGASGKSGTGKLATLKFKALKDNSQITFNKNTMVAAVGSTLNVLKSATGTTIQTSSAAAAVLPPVLNDIVVVPTPPSTAAAPAKQTKPTTTTATSGTKDTTPTPSFRKEEDFDYSLSMGGDEVGSDPVLAATPTSAFARFLAMLKAFFGGKNAQN